MCATSVLVPSILNTQAVKLESGGGDTIVVSRICLLLRNVATSFRKTKQSSIRPSTLLLSSDDYRNQNLMIFEHVLSATVRQGEEK